MEASVQTPTAMREVVLRPLTRETFAPFGDLITPTEDGAPFGSADAAPDLSRGTPRLYIMRLPRRGLAFSQITRHRNVTQCLAALGGKPWLIAVAPPQPGEEASPELQDIAAFCIPGTMAIKLHRGTWHAGPHFEDDEMSFLNLELSDTNEIDHQSSHLSERFGFALRFAVPPGKGPAE